MSKINVSASSRITSTAAEGPVDSTANQPLCRGILLIEPDTTVLSVAAEYLTNSNYCVTTASSLREVVELRKTKAAALAILSAALGRGQLGAVAETVRRQWPSSRILILGRAVPMLEDNLYDEQIEHSEDPKHLLNNLESLYKGAWSQQSNTIDWNARQETLFVIRSSVRESDPTKAEPGISRKVMQYRPQSPMMALSKEK